jgi:hypothetical protein
MKLKLFLISISLFNFLPVFAGGIFYNSNQSAEYFRTYERNAATDNADAVYYNMSGTTRMNDGLYANGSNQFFFQEATVKSENYPAALGDKTYKSDNPVLFCPNLYVLYKKDNWSVFSGIETIGATAIREWDDGLPTLDLLSVQNGGPGESYLKGSSYYMAWRVGGAYAFNDWFALALCGRAVYSQQKAQGYIIAASSSKVEFDYTDEAMGFSGEINACFFPVKDMVISLTYQMATPLDFERNINDGKNGGGLFTDGEKKRLDLPQVIRFGIS